MGSISLLIFTCYSYIYLDESELQEENFEEDADDPQYVTSAPVISKGRGRGRGKAQSDPTEAPRSFETKKRNTREETQESTRPFKQANIAKPNQLKVASNEETVQNNQKSSTPNFTPAQSTYKYKDPFAKVDYSKSKWSVDPEEDVAEPSSEEED